MGSITPAVVVCGDPGRATKIAARLQNAALLSERREYRAYQGTFQGVPITVCSHGIGAPGAAIAFEELIAAGGRRLVRVGSCGSLQPDIHAGCLIVATAAVQYTGYGRESVPDGYPAVADLDLSLALRQTAAESGRPWRSGIVLSRDSFYPGVQRSQVFAFDSWSKANVLAVEMECAALFIVGALRSVQTAAILAVDGNVLHTDGERMDTYDPHRQVVIEAIEAESEIALTALKRVESRE
jgi:uridine phosphorylase